MYDYDKPMTDAEFRDWYTNASSHKKADFWEGDKHTSHVAIAEKIDAAPE